jgi:hypothetical protein
MEDGLVDVAMAAFAQELLVREVVGGGLKVTVVEMLDLDGFFVLEMEMADSALQERYPIKKSPIFFSFLDSFGLFGT